VGKWDVGTGILLIMQIRNYRPEDYDSVATLYKDSSTYGGQFDEDRDSRERLEKLISEKPNAILVAEENGIVVGSVTLFEDSRSAWLFRFAVAENSTLIAGELYSKAVEILKSKGHKQVLVYAPVGNKDFEERYGALMFNKGDDYTCYWRDL
jgi:predicted N-acetyltransferase YhbS